MSSDSPTWGSPSPAAGGTLSRDSHPELQELAPDSLVWIELGTRRVRLGGATPNPDSAWVTQQARNLALSPQDEGRSPRFLIHDRDTKFSGSFDEVFRSEGMRIVLTPIRAPNANAFCERWVGTLRAECLDWTLILGRRHLERVLRAYIGH